MSSTPAACANASGAVRVTFGAGLVPAAAATERTVAVSCVAVPLSNVIVSPGWKPVRFAGLMPVAPAAVATDSVVLT